MKYIKSIILTAITSTTLLFSGCGSSGTASDEPLLGGDNGTKFGDGTEFAFTVEITSPNLNFTIPIKSDLTYNYNVDCDNDGVNEIEGATDAYTCEYTTEGNYTILIDDNNGDETGFPRFYAPAISPMGLDRKIVVGINQWGSLKWTNMESAFTYCSLEGVGGYANDKPDLSNVTNLGYMFDYTEFNQDIGDWNTSTITNMKSMFSNATEFNQSLNNWDVTSVTDMSNMFDTATSFDGNISNWDTSNVIQMTSMFRLTPFNQDISGWDVSKVTHMSYMFNGTTHFNQDISGWDVHNVYWFDYTFTNAVAFDQNLENWDTSGAWAMNGMFNGASSFNNNDLRSWDVSNVPSYKHFNFATNTGGGVIDPWGNSW